jgi:hypothetical protein
VISAVVMWIAGLLSPSIDAVFARAQRRAASRII